MINNYNLTDREIMDDVLASQKHITGVYNTFSNECVNQQLQHDNLFLRSAATLICFDDSIFPVP